MVLIEFYDKEAGMNLCGMLTQIPEKVILIGGAIKPMRRSAQRYEQILAARGYPVEVGCKSVNKNDLDGIVTALSEIVEKNEKITVDLTGGDDLMLVAMGIVYERYRHKGIQLQRFHFSNQKLYDCDMDGDVSNQQPVLSVEEQILACGGDVVFAEDKPHGTYRWDMSEEFIRDIEALWNISKPNPRWWNGVVRAINGSLYNREPEQDELTIRGNIDQIEAMLPGGQRKMNNFYQMLDTISDAGLLWYRVDGRVLTILYKNAQILRCMQKEGQVLEMKVYSLMRSLTGENGRALYDVMNGVLIDWDGNLHTQYGAKFDTENEIDVMAMRGMIPVFVSCKNGMVTMDELYKLQTVANRFGGSYARKVLVATALDARQAATQHLRQRATDMDIQMITDFAKMTGEEMVETFSHL